MLYQVKRELELTYRLLWKTLMKRNPSNWLKFKLHISLLTLPGRIYGLRYGPLLIHGLWPMFCLGDKEVWKNNIGLVIRKFELRISVWLSQNELQLWECLCLMWAFPKSHPRQNRPSKNHRKWFGLLITVSFPQSLHCLFNELMKKKWPNGRNGISAWHQWYEFSLTKGVFTE
jgi:hypothetical protein